jgi:hypothetical protein
MTGDPPDQTLVEAREALLDAVEALSHHLSRAVLVGAQAIYLHTSDSTTGVALFTKDADVALLPPLNEAPDIDGAMRAAGFTTGSQPGIWTSASAQVDLLVPEGFANPQGRRAARLPGHGSSAARKVAGLEAVVVDVELMTIASLRPSSSRAVRMSVAGPGALLISKLYKLGERAAEEGQRRLEPKDAFDTYRLLRLPTDDLARRVTIAQSDDRCAAVARFAVDQAGQLFRTPESIGSRLAGTYVAGIGDPEAIAAGVSALAVDLLAKLR